MTGRTFSPITLFAATLALLLAATFGTAQAAPRLAPAPAHGAIRVATYNTSLYHNEDRGLIGRLVAGDAAARQIAAVIQTVRPDIVLLNEFDYDARGEAAQLFVRGYLGRGQHGRRAIQYRYRYFAPVNTGVPSSRDLDGDGKQGGTDDAWGFGFHPGQYGMLVLSRFPIATNEVRTFQLLPWHRMPGALRPLHPDGRPYHDDAVWHLLRLSSKSHWDVPIRTSQGVLHFLVSHPTPPVFDGPEDRNGRRNHDEVRLWADYLDPQRAGWIVDDRGGSGGLSPAAPFVIAGDLNADPIDGAGLPGTMQQLLRHPRVRALPAPASVGAVRAAQLSPELNARHHTDPRLDTASFGAPAGNMRIDYVLPSQDFEIAASGVFWPEPGTRDAALLQASDHRLVWVDVRPARDGARAR